MSAPWIVLKTGTLVNTAHITNVEIQGLKDCESYQIVIHLVKGAPVIELHDDLEIVVERMAAIGAAVKAL